MQAAAAAGLCGAPEGCARGDPTTPGPAAERSGSTWRRPGAGERRGTWKEEEGEETEEDPGKSGWRPPGSAAAGARTRLGRLAFTEWEEAPRRGLLNRGLFPALSLLGYETPGKVDGCHGVMYAPPAVKEVYFWERVHTSSIPAA